MTARSLPGPDGGLRCRWCVGDALYMDYHDREWGFPVADDTRLFEKICLEGFQSGLSWRTILGKRENFRRAFAGFDIEAVAAFDESDVARLLADAGIVRHRAKIEAAINNARRARELIRAEGSLAAYIWRFEALVDGEGGNQDSVSVASKALSKDLKKRGWAFVGPTTAHAFLQAMGLINDHAPDCQARVLVEKARAGFVRPV